MKNLASTEEPDDANLARRIAAAHPSTDTEAEAALYRRLVPRIRLYGLRHLRDRNESSVQIGKYSFMHTPVK